MISLYICKWRPGGSNPDLRLKLGEAMKRANKQNFALDNAVAFDQAFPRLTHALEYTRVFANTLRVSPTEDAVAGHNPPGFHMNVNTGNNPSS